MADDGWTPRPDLDGLPADAGHKLFQRDGASLVECRSRVADGIEIVQGAVRWYKRENGRDLWVHDIFGGFFVPEPLPELVVSRVWKLGRPSKRDGEFPAEEFDERMRVIGDEALAAKVLKPAVKAWIAENLHHTKWLLSIGGRWVTISAEATILGNDDTAVHVARMAWSFHQLAYPDLVVERFSF